MPYGDRPASHVEACRSLITSSRYLAIKVIGSELSRVHVPLTVISFSLSDYLHHWMLVCLWWWFDWSFARLIAVCVRARAMYGLTATLQLQVASLVVLRSGSRMAAVFTQDWLQRQLFFYLIVKCPCNSFLWQRHCNQYIL